MADRIDAGEAGAGFPLAADHEGKHRCDVGGASLHDGPTHVMPPSARRRGASCIVTGPCTAHGYEAAPGAGRFPPFTPCRHFGVSPTDISSPCWQESESTDSEGSTWK